MYFASIAHELRTPLNSIIPMLRMILSTHRSSLDPRIINYLTIILNSALHLQNVIEDALDMSRIENDKFEILKELFNIRDALKEVCEVMDFQVQQKKLLFHVKVDDEVPELILSDQKRFRQIMFNIIGNALKFTFEGGITIRL